MKDVPAVARPFSKDGADHHEIRTSLQSSARAEGWTFFDYHPQQSECRQEVTRRESKRKGADQDNVTGKEQDEIFRDGSLQRNKCLSKVWLQPEVLSWAKPGFSSSCPSTPPGN